MRAKFAFIAAHASEHAIRFMMPDENGLQLAARIESNPVFAQTTLIMLSSADPRTEQDQLNDHRLKPVGSRTTVETVFSQ